MEHLRSIKSDKGLLQYFILKECVFFSQYYYSQIPNINVQTYMEQNSYYIAEICTMYSKIIILFIKTFSLITFVMSLIITFVMSFMNNERRKRSMTFFGIKVKIKVTRRSFRTGCVKGNIYPKLF